MDCHVEYHVKKINLFVRIFIITTTIQLFYLLLVGMTNPLTAGAH